MADPWLDKCPFCGGPAAFEPVVTGSVESWSVGCANNDVDCIAFMMLASFSRKVEAAEAWNKRFKPVNDVP